MTKESRPAAMLDAEARAKGDMPMNSARLAELVNRARSGVIASGEPTRTEAQSSDLTHTTARTQG